MSNLFNLQDFLDCIKTNVIRDNIRMFDRDIGHGYSFGVVANRCIKAREFNIKVTLMDVERLPVNSFSYDYFSISEFKAYKALRELLPDEIKNDMFKNEYEIVLQKSSEE